MKIKLNKSQWEMVGRKAGWLKTAQSSSVAQQINISNCNNRINQEAGTKETVLSVLLYGLSYIWAGATIKEVVEKLNLKEKDVIEAMQNPQLMEIAKEIYEEKPEEKPEEEPEEPQSQSHPMTKRQAWIENIVARTIYAEGSGESFEDKLAIASVIFNRANGNIEKIVRVIQTPKQFSCWNGASQEDWTNMKQRSGKDWEESKQIAKNIITGNFTPVTKADHYWNPVKANPKWAQNKNYEQFGRHRFIQLGKYMIA
jgi:spore germination cell wall hydrolase CwlJ-like protein